MNKIKLAKYKTILFTVVAFTAAFYIFECKSSQTLKSLSAQTSIEEKLSCEKDDDCIISSVRDGKCCLHLCIASSVYNKNYESKIATQQKNECKDTMCPVAGCVKPTFQFEAYCKAGRCDKRKIPWKD